MRDPDSLIHHAIQRAHHAGQQQALTSIFAALGRTLATQLNLAPSTVTKAIDREPVAAHPELEADPHEALLLAQLDHHIRCMETGENPKSGHRALHALWHSPDALAAVLSPHAHDDPQFAKAIAYALFLKAAERAPKGGIALTNHETGQSQFYTGGQWIPSQVIANATPEEKNELAERNAGARPNPLNAREKASAAAREKRGTVLNVRKHIATLATDIMAYPSKRTPDKYRDLAESVAQAVKDNHLSIHDLRSLRLKLSASFGGARRKEQMVAALLAHIEADPYDLASTPTQEEPAPRAAKPPRAPKSGTFALLKTDSLAIDPARFQFKLKTDASGVTDELKDVDKFDPDFAGVIAVWHDPSDNLTYVVNGHHRYELAKRSGYPVLAVRYLDAKDAREARARGALINIAEGRGTALDAAKFIRDSGGTGDELFKYGISQKSPLARDAAILTRLNDAAFDRLARGGLSMDTALAVAKHVTDPVRQEKLFKLLAKKEENGEKFTQKHIEEMARQMVAAPSVTTTSSTLWGDEDNEDDTFLERADLAAHIRGELSKEHHDYSALASSRRAGATAEAGNVLNVSENQKRASEAEVNRHAYDTLAHRKGPVSDALDAGAIAIKQARTKKEKERVRKETLANVRNAVASIASGQTAPAALATDTGRVGAVDGGRSSDSGAGSGGPGTAGAGEVAAHRGGAGNGATGVELPSVADVVASPAKHSFPPNVDALPGGRADNLPDTAVPADQLAKGAQHEREHTNDPATAKEIAKDHLAEDSAYYDKLAKMESGPATPATPLHELAHYAGNPAALHAEAKKLADLANKTKSQGGSLAFHDAMTAALRGEHGPEVRDAVARALEDWNSHGGDTAKRYARVAEEVAKIGKKAEPEAMPEKSLPAYKDIKRIEKDVRGPQVMNQRRAYHGEIGPNGEVYPGGAFIATQDIPKRIKDKLAKEAKGSVRVGKDRREVPKPGEMSIVDKLGGTVLNPRTGEVNEQYLDYIKATPEQREMYNELAAKHRAGEEWVPVNDYPELANLTDAARLYAAGEPIPGAVLSRLPAEFSEKLKKWAPPSGTGEPKPATESPAIASTAAPPSNLSLRSFGGRADDYAPTEEEIAAASKPAAPAETTPASPGKLDVADIYNRAGSTAKHSEINAALRYVGAMSKSEATAAVKAMGYAPNADPRRQLAELISDRKAAQIRGLQSGSGRAIDAAKSAAYEPLRDEPLLSVDDALGAAAPNANPAGKTAPKPATSSPASLPSVADIIANPAQSRPLANLKRPGGGENSHEQIPAPATKATPEASSPNVSAPTLPERSAHGAEQQTYSAKSARAITSTPDMTRDQKAKSAHISPLPQAESHSAMSAKNPNKNSPTIVDNATSVGNNTPVPPEGGGSTGEGGKVDEKPIEISGEHKLVKNAKRGTAYVEFPVANADESVALGSHDLSKGGENVVGKTVRVGGEDYVITRVNAPYFGTGYKTSQQLVRSVSLKPVAPSSAKPVKPEVDQTGVPEGYQRIARVVQVDSPDGPDGSREFRRIEEIVPTPKNRKANWEAKAKRVALAATPKRGYSPRPELPAYFENGDGDKFPTTIQDIGDGLFRVSARGDVNFYRKTPEGYVYVANQIDVNTSE